MDGLSLSITTTANSFSAIQFFSQPFHRKSRIVSFPYRKPRSLLVFASKDDSELDEWDKMELQFFRMLGEDPKIALSKIMVRKSNPDLSYLEIEKLIEKKKGKAWNEETEEIPFDPSREKNSTESMQGLNLVRPVPKKGTRFEASNKPVKVSGEKKSTESIQGLNLVRPVPKNGTKFEATNKPVERNAKNSIRPVTKITKETNTSVPDVILRKRPSRFRDDNSGTGKFSMLEIRPSLSLKMQKDPPERFTDTTLLKKPEPMRNNLEQNDHSDSSEGKAVPMDEIGDNGLTYGTTSEGKSDTATLLQKPERMKLNLNKEGEQESSLNVVTENNLDISNPDNQLVMAAYRNLNQFEETRRTDSELDEGSATELQADTLSHEKTFASDGAAASTSAMSMDTVLIGKPKRLDHSGKVKYQKNREEVLATNPEIPGDSPELENFLATSPIKEREDGDWARAEAMVKIGGRGTVEVISSSTRGFVVLFGSLIGFVPYRNLSARLKYIAFESWLRRKGLDPSMYRQYLGIIGKYETADTPDTSELVVVSEAGSKTGPITSDMKLEDILMIYDQDKLKFLSSFVGQKINVGVVLADRNSRRLIFSVKPKEKEELVEKKRYLMEQLSVGDIVKCCIKKVTYFGVIVEVEGVPALIHQTEVSWDATLDPASYFKVGQIIEAKVHQLDFSMERLFLSLKEMAPDPLLEALEAVAGDHDPLNGRLEAAQPDTEWDDVESLIKELQQFDGIQSVLKGRYFLSPGLAPTFQVYMASIFENQYKLLARAGNKVQEVIVETELGKAELKSAILTCTNRVG